MRFIAQYDQMDCGPACISMVANSYGKEYPLEYLRENSYITKEGVSLLGIGEASKKIGFDYHAVKEESDHLISNIENTKKPVILHWDQNHFVVLNKVSNSLFSKKKIFEIYDPAHGIIKISQEKFEESWISDRSKGVSVYLTPTDTFYQNEPPQQKLLTVKQTVEYLQPYKKKIALMFCLLLAGSGITLIFPFLTQSLIDDGVSSKNLNFIFIILLAQLSLFLGSIVINIFRNWLTLYIGTHLSIKIISDFLKKIIELPIRFFDTKLLGDFQQRIQDNNRIEEFLTSQSLLTFFSIVTFSVFFGVLAYYDVKILLVYSILTLISIAWSFYWLRKRKIMDYFRFKLRSENQDSIYEMLNGVTEMKLNQFEDFKISEWEKIQKRLFQLNIRILKIDQYQLSGFEFLNQLKNIIVTFLAATYVVKGSMSLGVLLSVSYIIGQMNSPVSQMINFFRSFQDAKLSMERLNEVQFKSKEEKEDDKPIESNEETAGDILFENVSFQYEGPQSPYVLKDISLTIPQGKVTAIVGASGSGKTTLMKLLLRFYNPVSGKISFGKTDILHISPKSIRKSSGVVLQDGFIFSDTVARNIITHDENSDDEKLLKAVTTSNISEFVNSLPLRYNTKIGASGNGISGGQKQRILIARAVYKNPQYLFFDEATSALDAENEKIIHDNLQEFFKGKTVVIIAHRLSTVKNADNIIVLNGGKIVEEGNHQEIVSKNGEYYKLVKNQLELGS
ncbi:peptidase domain-containing ABC transporter [Chryseobacterium sp.]|uniref:peptidase domain-containing ABC transporter n=1 Tax=Chryseobacterium sp. TaxID=1871047 RepID=UPI0024E256CB|nr:peptidase domain-containing ABC transporter [Chryseobacterium sp.]